MPNQGNRLAPEARRTFLKKAGTIGALGMVGTAGCLGDDDDSGNEAGNGGNGGNGGGNGDGNGGNGGDDFPNQRFNFVVPYSEGGGSDTWFRQLATPFSESHDVDVQIENITGAASLRGQGEVFTRAQDGHHLSMTHIPSTPGAALLNDPGWDPRDMSMVGGFSYYTICFFGNPKYEFEGFQDVFDRYADGEFSRVGGLGFGHTYHLISLLMREDPEIEWDWDTWVNYDGSGPMISAVASDEVPFGLTSSQPLVSHHEDGAIDLIGSLYSEGSQPVIEAGIDIPSLTDEGYPNYDTFGAVTRGLVTGPDVPEERRQVLEDTLQEALEHDSVIEWSEETGNIRSFSSGEDLQGEMNSAYEMLQERINFDEIEA